MRCLTTALLAMAREFPFGPESIEAAYSSLIHEGYIKFNSIPLQFDRASYDNMSWHLSILSFLYMFWFLRNSGFIQLSDVTLTAWKGGHGRQSEWSLQTVWVALKSFETHGQGGSAIVLDTDKSTEVKDIQKKTRILSYDVL